MVILGNFKDNYDTATTIENKSKGFDLSATQSCKVSFITLKWGGSLSIEKDWVGFSIPHPFPK